MTNTNSKIPISFELFPTKTKEGFRKLNMIAVELSKYQPKFFSVTHGSGGSTRDRTMDTVLSIRSCTDIPTVPHLSCVGDSKKRLKDFLQKYKEQGINHIVALRGDLPSGMNHTNSELQYANELVEFIRLEMGNHFYLEVAAYPETHPQAKNLEADLINFKRKVDAGANSAITQYFFNPDSYFYFVDRVMAMGIDLPIVPGIMPITNYRRLDNFSDACGAEIPRWIRKQLEAYGNDIDSIKKFGEEVISRLCEKLIKQGVPGLHFYALNQAEPSKAICRNLKLTYY